MAQNYASKFSSKVDERFAIASVTNAAVNNEYDFVGVNAVNVYSIETVELGDYTLSGSNRYGSPAEINDTKQTLTLSQDKAFTFAIDKRNAEDSVGAKEAGRALRRQIDEKVIPAIDKYRIQKLVEGAGTTATEAAVTKDNAYDVFLDGTNALMENGVPESGRIAFVSANFYKSIKLDPSFIQASDMAQDMLVRGSVGMVDGVQIIPVPTSYLPANVEFVITHPVAMCSPVKLSEYITHDNPPGINGTLIEGRIYFDAFVMDQKKKAIYLHKHPGG